MEQRLIPGLMRLAWTGVAVGVVLAALGSAQASNIRDYQPRPSLVPYALPGQAGFVPPTLMHLDPCGDRVEGRSRDDVEEFWEEIEDAARDAYKDAVRDRLAKPEAEVAAAREAAKEAIEEGGNRWDAAVAAAAAVRRTGGELTAAGQAAYEAVISRGGSAREADDAASWAVERASQIPAEWKPKQMIRHDRWCLRSLQEVQISINRRRELERQRRIERLYYDPFYRWPFYRHRPFYGFHWRLH